MTRSPAAGWRGFFPGDDLPEMPSGGRQIQWLKISRVSGGVRLTGQGEQAIPAGETLSGVPASPPGTRPQRLES